ncbi:MAG: alpha/beta fold hydrolase [Candidatus Thorarchaeota archaeon]
MLCKLQNIEIYYEIYGEGIPILMIHGFTPDHHIVKGPMEPIFQNRSGFKRIYFDLPGMGKTEGKKWIKNSDQILEIVTQFIEKIIPNEKFLIVSESYGGYLARGLIYKNLYQILGICFICPLIVPDPQKRELPEFTPIIQEKSLLETIDPKFRDEFENFVIIQNERVWKGYKDNVLIGLQAADQKFLDDIFSKGYAFSFDVDKMKKKFEKPVLFLLGKQDIAVGYKDAWKILESYPRASFVILDKAGHLLEVEQNILFESLLNEWLDRVIETIN